MAGSTLKHGSGKELKKLFALMTSAIGETLGSLVGRELALKPAEVEVLDDERLIASLHRPYVVARGALSKDFAGKTIYAMFEVQDAVAMAGMLMMTPDHVIEQRRTKSVLEGEDLEAFGELGNVLYSGIGNVLRENVPNVDVRLQDHGQVQPSVDKDKLIAAGPLAAFGFRLKVGSFPETTAYLVTDLPTAEAWNKAPLECGEDPVAAAPAGASGKPGAGGRLDDDGLDAIPPAPIRGVLAAYVLQAEVLRTLRRSCRRVGLELRRHGRGEIPNPAAHKNEIVLLDVPPGEDRRFDWVRRIKEFSATAKVVLLIHHPSRPRVTQAFLSRADVILGFPCDEGQLSHKLGTMLPEESPPAPASPAPAS